MCYLAAHDGALVLVSSSVDNVDFLCFAFLISNHSVRFLSALLAMTGTGNFIFARVLLGDLTSVQHASATSVPNLTHSIALCNFPVKSYFDCFMCRYGLLSGISNMSGILGPAVYV